MGLKSKNKDLEIAHIPPISVLLHKISLELYIIFFRVFFVPEVLCKSTTSKSFALSHISKFEQNSRKLN